MCVLLFLATAASCLAQGTVSFQNNVPFTTADPTGGNRRVYDVGSPLDLTSGVGLVGTNWVAELYAGIDAASLATGDCFD